MAAAGPLPCTTLIGVAAARQRSVSVVKPAVKSSSIRSGGSLPSWSVTLPASTVRVHASPVVKSVSGLIVNTVGPPETVAVWAPLEAHSRVNQVAAVVTASLKVTVML